MNVPCNTASRRLASGIVELVCDPQLLRDAVDDAGTVGVMSESLIVPSRSRSPRISHGRCEGFTKCRGEDELRFGKEHAEDAGTRPNAGLLVRDDAMGERP